MRIADFSTRHPTIIGILAIALVVFGVISLVSLRQDLLSDVQLPSIAILTIYPGASARDVERDVTAPLEEEITTIAGVQSMSSTSEPSTSVISVEFEYGEDLDRRMSELREAINDVAARLPEGLDGPPRILKINTELLPVLSIAVESDMAPAELTRFVEDNVTQAIARVSGVATVTLQGATHQELQVTLDLGALESRGVAVLEVFELLKRNNVSLPSGDIVFRGESLPLRTRGEFSTIREIEEMVVGESDGVFIRIRDIANVERAEVSGGSAAESAGESILVIDVMKQPAGDTVQIAEDVAVILRDIEAEHHGAVSFATIADQSEDIQLAIASVRDSAVFGGVLAVLILLLFLHNVRTTIIIAVSIPLSVLVAFIALRLGGQSLNLMTLGGLTVGIGMIVDSSIVVLENIHRHFDESGDAGEAARIGTGEVGGAIVASTSTTLSVFFPLLFVSGFAGIVLRDVAYTIVYALTAALIIAVAVVPFMASLLLRRRQPAAVPSSPSRGAESANPWSDAESHSSASPSNKPRKNVVGRVVDRSLEWLESVYTRALRYAIDHRAWVVFLALSVLAASALSFNFLGFEFVPETDMNEINVSIETPHGFTLDQTREKVRILDSRIRELVPEIEESLFYIGQGGFFGFTSDPNLAYGRLRLSSTKNRERSTFDIIRVLRRDLPKRVTDTKISVDNGGLGAMATMATGGGGFSIEVYGTNLDNVLAAAEMVESIMARDPNVEQTELNISLNQQEVVADLALGYMGTLGVTPYEAAVTSRILFNGMSAGSFRQEGHSYDLVLRSEVAGARVGEDVLSRIRLRSSRGRLISFSAFSTLEAVPSVSEIHRQDRQTSVVVNGTLAESDVRGTSARVTEAMGDLALPVGVRWQVTGSAAEMMDSFRSLLGAMAISVFLVYAVMVIQFERFAQPLVVMASVPFTMIGVVIGLLAFGSTLSIVSFLAVIALAGIVVNNAIVLIDYTNLLRRRDGMPLGRAVIAGARARLRPILMTTLTTVLGVLPMAMGLGEGAGMYAPLGQAIAGGLLTSTLITLFLVPVLYVSVEKRHKEIPNG